jgi:hypothetical protein
MRMEPRRAWDANNGSVEAQRRVFLPVVAVSNPFDKEDPDPHYSEKSNDNQGKNFPIWRVLTIKHRSRPVDPGPQLILNP